MAEIVHYELTHYTETGLPPFGRPVTGIFIHDTEAPSADGFAWPADSEGSWHLEIARDGTLHRFVPDEDVAWTVKVCDRWYPFWLPRTRPWDASPANCWGLHVELASNAKFRQQGRAYTQAQYARLREVVAEWRRRYGPLPLVGHGLVQADRTDPVDLDWEQLQNPQSLWPLSGVSRVDPREGGYGFLEWTGDTYHPGIDLNAGAGGAADAGAPTLAPTGMTVQYVGWHVTSTGKGFGWHTWALADDGHWLHFCHAQARPSVAVGEYLPRRRVFALCGKTAGWPWEHVHFEVRHARPPNGDWGYWPQGVSRAAVAAQYVDPFMYLAAVAADPEQEEPMPILSDAQLVAVQAGAWAGYAFSPDFAIPKAWRAEVQAGRNPGRPVTDEQRVPDESGATVQWFESGRFATYVPGRDVSWNG
jgi:murein DD-endopeptidase MepM/ murein hydrolase activator NlpD